MSTRALVASGFALFAAYLAGWGVWDLLKTRRLVRHGLRATGTLADYEKIWQGGSRRNFPVIEFTDHGGITRRITLNISATRHEMGSRVPVVYDPQDLPNARIESTEGLWFLGAACVAFGALLATFAALIWTGAIKA